MDTKALQPLNHNNFPTANPYIERTWELQDGTICHGKYSFNKTMARRWIDSNGNEYTSDLIKRWC